MRALLAGLILIPCIAQADWSHSNKGQHNGWQQNRWPQHNADHCTDDNHYNQSRTGYDRLGYNRGPGEVALRQGYYDGRLSSRELRDLREKQQELEREQIKYQRDGWISRSERGELDHDYREFYGSLNHELNDGERW